VSGNGNIEHPSRKKDPIQAGDYVRIKPSEMDAVEMSPKEIFNLGFPNEFLVLTTFEHEGQRCLTIEECCERRRNRATGQYLCNGHPERYFEKTEPVEHRRTSERRFLAFEAFGMRASIEYVEGQKKLLLRIPGTTDGMSLSGDLARNIAEAAKSIGMI